MFSIIIPVYNIKEYISECLESASVQTYSNIEVIIIDDGSTDGSGQICDEFASKDARFKVIHKINEGLVRARKDGVLAASGDYVCFVDGDDFIEPEMIGRSVGIFEKEKVDVVLFGRYTDTNMISCTGQQGFPMGKYDRERLENEIYPYMIANGFMEWGIYPAVWDKAFKRELLLESQMAVDDRITMGEDAACVFPCLLKADSIYISDECFYHYRQRPTSMVRNASDSKKEKERFKVLYENVAGRLSDLAYTREFGDRLLGQWRKFMLFLMIPRADVLYDGVKELDYLFPYPNVKKGDSVVIYGAGIYGARLYVFLKHTGFCNVKAIVDRDYKNLSTADVPVLPPEAVFETDADHVIIALSFEKTREKVYEYLKQRLPETKIETMDMGLVHSKDTWQRFMA